MFRFLVFLCVVDFVFSKNTVCGTPKNTTLREKVKVEIVGYKNFTFSPLEKSLVSSDVFQDGHFSIFDCLVYLSKEGEIKLTYHYEKEFRDFVIDDLNGSPNWWYQAGYDTGKPGHYAHEKSAVRMKDYKIKDKMMIRILPIDKDELSHIREMHKKAVHRFESNDQKIIIPQVLVNITKEQVHLVFRDVEIPKSYNLRGDIYKPDVFTGIDVMMRIGELDKTENMYLWYTRLWNSTKEEGNPEILAYRIESVNGKPHSGACGWIYEYGEWEDFDDQGTLGNQPHVQPDERLLFSPAYYLVKWVELGPC